MLDDILLKIILFCHFLVVCFVVSVPFFGNNYLLLMHSITVPFMMVHWITNDNTCVLSLMEVEIRKRLGIEIKEQDCFTCQLINPVYDFKANNEQWSTIIYIVTTCLMLLSMFRLYCSYEKGDIQNIQDIITKENTTKIFNFE